MIATPSRRIFVAGATATAVAAPAVAASDRFGEIEARVGGRLGVAALDVESGARLDHRAGERFPMCSTFKVMAVAALLSRVDRGADQLDRRVRYTAADLLDYAPVTRARVGEGGMPLADLCAAAIELSDNTAANLILDCIGGPAGWTSFARVAGDAVSRLDRTEPTLNTAEAGDPRDTTTPLAMLGALRMVVLGKLLSTGSRERLAGWMGACQTGAHRLRSGLPAAWRVGDKTGSGAHGTANDIAVAWTPQGAIVITAYLTGAERAAPADLDAAYADIGRAVVQAFRPEASAAAHG